MLRLEALDVATRISWFAKRAKKSDPDRPIFFDLREERWSKLLVIAHIIAVIAGVFDRERWERQER